MVEKAKDPERARQEVGTEVGDADPTLDIVRKLIVDAAALPAPAPRPPGPATPRPGPVLQVPVAAPPPPPPVPDADPDVWGDDPEPDDWDDLYVSASGGYAIVDLDDDEMAGPAEAIAPAPPGRAPRRLLRRGMRALGRLLWRGMRALGRWVGALLAAAAARVERFLRRPDAPRRLALGLLVIFVIAWPWTVLKLTLLIPLAAAITWASVGSEGCAELVVRWHRRLKARDPGKAERIRLRAAAASRALTRGLERLPARWTSGIYLPDFEPEGYVPEKLKVDPFEELAARVHSAKRASGDT